MHMCVLVKNRNISSAIFGENKSNTSIYLLLRGVECCWKTLTAIMWDTYFEFTGDLSNGIAMAAIFTKLILCYTESVYIYLLIVDSTAQHIGVMLLIPICFALSCLIIIKKNFIKLTKITADLIWFLLFPSIDHPTIWFDELTISLNYTAQKINQT